jgi:hypothetical protein
MGSGMHRGSGMMGSGGPFVTTTTVTTVLDLSTGVTKTFHSSNPSSGGSERSSYPFGSYGGYGGEKRMTEGGSGAVSPLFNVLSENDISVLVNSWNILKKRSEFAPKVFLRYFLKY